MPSNFFKFAAHLILVAGLVLPIGVSQAQAVSLDAGFDPNAIISDNDIFDAGGMTYGRLVSFLRSKGTLADAQLPDIDGVTKSAPEIIWRVSQSYKINPRYLIALLQKEQSLVEDPYPSQKQLDWATGYGVCDDCSMNDPALQHYKGFAAQLEWAAKQHREKYLMQLLTKGYTIGGQGPGKTMIIDGQPVTPVNHATAMLYTYTPHIHGNLNLWRIWRRWFSTTYPDGTVVRGQPGGYTYMIRFGEKRRFASKAVVSALVDETKIVTAGDTELAVYPDGPQIKFTPYSLLRDPQGRIYLLTTDAKRHIANMEAFRKFGFNEDEVIEAEASDLMPYADGIKITVATSFPQGILMRTAASSTVWYVEDGTRHALNDPVLLKLYFRGRKPKTVTQKTIAGLALGASYRLHDGELIKMKGAAAVYVVENGVLRPIPSAEIFESVGWKWKNIVTVTEPLFNAHSLGEPFASVSPVKNELASANL